MRSFIIVLGIAVAVSACGSKSAKKADCKQAAINYVNILKAHSFALAEEYAGEKLDDTERQLLWRSLADSAGFPVESEDHVEFLARRCKEDGESQARRTCWARALSFDELMACKAVDGPAAPVATVPAPLRSESKAPPPARVTITLDSEPPGAEIYDVSMKTVVGMTPIEFEVPGTREPRTYSFKLAGYVGKGIEIVPDEDVNYKATLKKLDGEATGTVEAASPERPPRAPTSASNTATGRGVDPDCYGDGFTCDRSRVDDAEQLARALTPTMSAAGWPVDCFTVQYISGDTGEGDAISVAVSGPKGGGAARCREEAPGRAARADVARTAKTIRRALGEYTELIRGVDLLQVTDGVDAEIQLPLP